MDSLQTLPASGASNKSNTRKRRIAQLGLDTGDIVVMRTILQASHRLARLFDFNDMSAKDSADILFVNGEDNASVETCRQLCLVQPDTQIIMVGGSSVHRPGDRYIKRPISPRLLEAALLPDGSSDKTGSQPALHPSIASAPDGKQLRILVVDDSLPAREYIRIKIDELCKHSAGIRVDTASSGEQALKKYEECQYDLIFLDVEMPGMDGFVTCQKLKATNPAVRIVMLTSKSLSQDYRKGREVGCNHYLTKPPIDNDVKTILTLASLAKTTA